MQQNTTNLQDLPTVLVISTGLHLYREYLLKQISESANVWLFLDKEPTWQMTYICGYSLVETLDVERMIEAARNLPKNVKIDGVICWDEIRMVPTSLVAEALDLPGGNSDAFRRCRDKHLTRTALAAAGVPQAESILVSTIEEAAAAAESIGYPVIVKPRALGSSYGVSLANNAEELFAALSHANFDCAVATNHGYPLFDKSVLVEEYMQGQEVSVDVAWVNGKMFPLFVGRKMTGFFPYFEEIGHVVHASDPLLKDPQFLSVIESAHKAIGFNSGITHSELRLTSKGPKIVEINSRLGGDMIPYIGWVASGISPGAVVVAAACGREPDVQLKRDDVAAVHFLYPEIECQVKNLRIERAELPQNIKTATLLAGPGQKLRIPPSERVSGRYAFLIAQGKSAEECQATIESALKAVKLDAKPLATAEAQT